MSGFAQPHAPEIWDRCRHLVVEDGMTLSAAAEEVGIPLSTVEKRAAREDWTELREEARQQAQSYRARVYRLKNKLLNSAIESGDVQKAQAWRSVESAYPEKTYAGVSDAQKRHLVGFFVTRLVGYLNEHAPSLSPLLQDHLEGFSEIVAAADWEGAQ